MSASFSSLRASSARFRRTLFSVVLLALVLAQTLGLVHRIVHSPLALHSTAPSGAPPTRPVSDWLKALFAGHSTEQGCELYDQLGHADFVALDAVPVPLLHPTEASVASRPVLHLAAQAAGFLARGPPRAS
ncbi:MAG TPA: hypothetical protein VF319_17885 [Caldimonas sp.]